MSEKEAFKLYQKAQKFIGQGKFNKAIEILDKSLSIDSENITVLQAKGFALAKLGKFDKSYQTYFQENLIRLRRGGDIPSDINSIEFWIEAAKELIKKEDHQRASGFLAQASFLSPIEDRKGGFMAHHKNATIYYYTAITDFNKGNNYEDSMALFKKALNLDPNLKIPDDIQQKYQEFLANRNGKDVEQISNLDLTSLKTIIPSSDKILCSTYADAQSSYSPIVSNRTTFYKWSTHLLLTLNGIALMVAKQVSQTATHYIPWGLTKWGKPRRGRTLWVSQEAEDFKYPILLTLQPNYAVDKQSRYEYFDRFKPIWENQLIKMKEKIKENLESVESLGLDFIPTYDVYIGSFERVPKSIYKKVRKEFIKEKKDQD